MLNVQAVHVLLFREEEHIKAFHIRQIILLRLQNLHNNFERLMRNLNPNDRPQLPDQCQSALEHIRFESFSINFNQIHTRQTRILNKLIKRYHFIGSSTLLVVHLKCRSAKVAIIELGQDRMALFSADRLLHSSHNLLKMILSDVLQQVFIVGAIRFKRINMLRCSRPKQGMIPQISPHIENGIQFAKLRCPQFQSFALVKSPFFFNCPENIIPAESGN